MSRCESLRTCTKGSSNRIEVSSLPFWLLGRTSVGTRVGHQPLREAMLCDPLSFDSRHQRIITKQPRLLLSTKLGTGVCGAACRTWTAVGCRAIGMERRPWSATSGPLACETCQGNALCETRSLQGRSLTNSLTWCCGFISSRGERGITNFAM